MRARNIKPGFYANDRLAECSFPARLLFPGLWMLADREGRLEDRPKKIKGLVLPFDSLDAEPLLQELTKAEMIVRFEARGVKVIEIVNFKKHQRPHVNEQASILPSYKERTCEESGKGSKCSVQGDNHFALNPSSLNPESLILNPEYSTPTKTKTTSSVTPRMHPEPSTSADLAQLFAATYTGANRSMKNPVEIEPFFAELLRRGRSAKEITERISAAERSRNESTAQFEINSGFAPIKKINGDENIYSGIEQFVKNHAEEKK